MRRFLLTLLLCVIVFAFLPASAQPNNLMLHIEAVYDDDFPNVQVEVAVRDENQPVTGLTAADFTVLEDGTPAEIEEVALSQLGVNVVLVIDTSESMFAMLSAREAAAAFVDALAADDHVALIDFDTSIKVLQPLTQEHDQVREAISTQLEQGGRTALYDGTLAGVREATSGTQGRRIVILLSDGADSGDSISGRSTALDEALAAGIPIYTIGLGATADRTYLENIATLTGGQYFNAPNAAELTTLYTTLAENLRKTYLITFVSQVAGDGAAHRLSVQVQRNQAEATFTAAEILPTISLGDMPAEPISTPMLFTPAVTRQGTRYEIRWLLDGEPAPNAPTVPPFALRLDPRSLTPGTHTLTAIIADAAGHEASTDLEFEVAAIAPTVDLQGIPDSPVRETFNLSAEIQAATESYTLAWLLDGEPVAAETALEIDPLTLLPGEHTVTLTVTDAQELSTTTEATFEVAPLPPAITLTDLPATVEEATKITAEIRSQQPITTVSFQVDDQGAVEDTTAPYEYTLDPFALAAGDHTLTVSISGAEVAQSLDFVTTIAAPTVIFNGIPAAEVTEAFTLEAVIDAQTRQLELEWLLDDEPIRGRLAAPYTLELDPVALAPGEHQVSLSVTDDRGLSSTADAAFTIAALPPSITLRGLADGAALQRDKLTVNLEIESQTPLAHVQYQINDAEPLSLSLTPFRFTLDPVALAALGLAEHRLTVTAANESELSTELVLNFTTTFAVPQITLNGLPDTESREPFSMTAAVEADSPVEVMWLLDGEEIETQPASEIYRLEIDPAALEPGEHTLTVRATDESGLYGEVTDQVFTVAALEPVVNAVNLIEGQTLKEEAVQLSLNAESQTPVTNVVYQLDDQEPVTVSAAPYPYTLDPAALENGDHQLGITVNTAGGQSTIKTLNFKVDKPGLLDNPLLPAAGIGAVLLVLVVVGVRYTSVGTPRAVVPKATITYDDPLAGKPVTYKIRNERTSIGRASGNDIVLIDPGQNISREHAAIIYRGKHWLVEDLNSKRGVLVNGEKVSGTRLLGDKDKISLGGIELVLSAPGFILSNEDLRATRAEPLPPELAEKPAQPPRQTLVKAEDDELRDTTKGTEGQIRQTLVKEDHDDDLRDTTKA